MLGDLATGERCIALADAALSLRKIGVPRYDALYRAVARPPGGSITSGTRPCPACDAPSGHALRRFPDAGLLRCSTCGLGYTGRAPSYEELTACYANYPVDADVPPVTAARLDQIVASFEPYRHLGTLLDVGAGSGHLLNAAAHAGWRTHGIEFGPRQRERLSALGHVLHPPLLQAQNIADGSFDVVVLQEVIEHMRDPDAELREVARILRPGGLLYVTCPNFTSVSRWLLGPRWRVIGYPEHLNYFTPSALRRLAARHGLGEVAHATTGLSVGDVCAAVRSRPPASGGRASTDQRIRQAGARHRAVAVSIRGANAILSALELGDTIKGRYVRLDPSSRR
jgi:SAM-dependent methyltransferase